VNILYEKITQFSSVEYEETFYFERSHVDYMLVVFTYTDLMVEEIAFS